VGLTAAFLLLRAVNVYGDPNRWERGGSALETVISFLNTTKYPPSLLFLLVPLFYYALHAAVIHVIAIGICYARYGQVHWMFESPTIRDYPVTSPPGWGLSLPLVYAVWVLVVLALYPVCHWYAELKQRRHDWWLSYL
jgi:hypothetical protein